LLRASGGGVFAAPVRASAVDATSAAERVLAPVRRRL